MERIISDIQKIICPCDGSADGHMDFVAHDYCQQALSDCWYRSDVTGTRYNYWLTTISNKCSLTVGTDRRLKRTYSGIKGLLI